MLLQLDTALSNTFLEINQEAVIHNLKQLRCHLPKNTRIMAIVKANAYGTDAPLMIRLLEKQGVDLFGVAYVHEAIELRKKGIKSDLFVVHFAPEEASLITEYRLEVALHSEDSIQALGNQAREDETLIPVHLHVDSGMKRLGCSPDEAIILTKKILDFPHLQFQGVMSHLTSADVPSHDFFSVDQATILKHIMQKLENEGIESPFAHLCNSAGAKRFNFSSFNLVRIGLALYGIKSPQSNLDLKSALSLKSSIIHTHALKKGDTVSYGRTYTAKSDHVKVAVIPIGYYDGIHRHYRDKAEVLIRGNRCKVVGTICMDFLMVEVSHLPEVNVGDTVTFFGADEFGNRQSVQEFAAFGDTIAHELISCLGPRIQRKFV